MVDFIILKEHRLIIERFHGHVNFSAIETASYAIWNHPDYDARYKGLVDIRGCSVSFDIKDVGRIATFFFKSAATSKGFMIILADSSQSIARSYVFNNRVSRFMNVHILSNFNSALRNLEITEDLYDKINSHEAHHVVLSHAQ